MIVTDSRTHNATASAADTSPTQAASPVPRDTAGWTNATHIDSDRTATAGMQSSTAAPTDELEHAVRSALAESPYGPLRGVEMTVERHGRIRLHGQVGSYFLKQMAQTTVLRVPAVQRIENELHVVARS